MPPRGQVDASYDDEQTTWDLLATLPDNPTEAYWEAEARQYLRRVGSDAAVGVLDVELCHPSMRQKYTAAERTGSKLRFQLFCSVSNVMQGGLAWSKGADGDTQYRFRVPSCADNPLAEPLLYEVDMPLVQPHDQPRNTLKDIAGLRVSLVSGSDPSRPTSLAVCNTLDFQTADDMHTFYKGTAAWLRGRKSAEKKALKEAETKLEAARRADTRAKNGQDQAVRLVVEQTRVANEAAMATLAARSRAAEAEQRLQQAEEADGGQRVTEQGIRARPGSAAKAALLDRLRERCTQLAAVAHVSAELEHQQRKAVDVARKAATAAQEAAQETSKAVHAAEVALQARTARKPSQDLQQTASAATRAQGVAKAKVKAYTPADLAFVRVFEEQAQQAISNAHAASQAVEQAAADVAATQTQQARQAAKDAADSLQAADQQLTAALTAIASHSALAKVALSSAGEAEEAQHAAAAAAAAWCEATKGVSAPAVEQAVTARLDALKATASQLGTLACLREQLVVKQAAVVAAARRCVGAARKAVEQTSMAQSASERATKALLDPQPHMAVLKASQHADAARGQAIEAIMELQAARRNVEQQQASVQSVLLQVQQASQQAAAASTSAEETAAVLRAEMDRLQITESFGTALQHAEQLQKEAQQSAISCGQALSVAKQDACEAEAMQRGAANAAVLHRGAVAPQASVWQAAADGAITAWLAALENSAAKLRKLADVRQQLPAMQIALRRAAASMIAAAREATQRMTTAQEFGKHAAAALLAKHLPIDQQALSDATGAQQAARQAVQQVHAAVAEVTMRQGCVQTAVRQEQEAAKQAAEQAAIVSAAADVLEAALTQPLQAAASSSQAALMGVEVQAAEKQVKAARSRDTATTAQQVAADAREASSCAQAVEPAVLAPVPAYSQWLKALQARATTLGELAGLRCRLADQQGAEVTAVTEALSAAREVEAQTAKALEAARCVVEALRRPGRLDIAQSTQQAQAAWEAAQRMGLVMQNALSTAAKCQATVQAILSEEPVVVAQVLQLVSSMAVQHDAFTPAGRSQVGGAEQRASLAQQGVDKAAADLVAQLADAAQKTAEGAEAVLRAAMKQATDLGDAARHAQQKAQQASEQVRQAQALLASAEQAFPHLRTLAPAPAGLEALQEDARSAVATWVTAQHEEHKALIGRDVVCTKLAAEQAGVQQQTQAACDAARTAASTARQAVLAIQDVAPGLLVQMSGAAVKAATQALQEAEATRLEAEEKCATAQAARNTTALASVQLGTVQSITAELLQATQQAVDASHRRKEAEQAAHLASDRALPITARLEQTEAMLKAASAPSQVAWLTRQLELLRVCNSEVERVKADAKEEVREELRRMGPYFFSQELDSDEVDDAFNNGPRFVQVVAKRKRAWSDGATDADSADK